MELKKIISKLESLFPPKKALEGDSIGLQIGNIAKEIENVLVVLDVCDATIEQAIQNRCDVIISHHPFFRGNLREALRNPHFKKQFDTLQRNKIAVYVMHTNYDCANSGMNDVLVKMYEPDKIGFLNGENHLGKVGTYKSGRLLSDMILLTSKLFGLNAVQVVDCNDDPIEKFAICGGSGSKEQINDAINKRCNLLITGELNYHSQLYAKEMGLNIILATHFMEVVFISHVKNVLENLKNINVFAAKQDDPITIWK